jgi:hypothetical protein
MAQVKFISVRLQATYDALATKEVNSLYFVQETNRFYHGSLLMGVGALATEQAAGLLSPEDYASLKTLIASGGGINNLRPVDNSIIVTKDGDGATVGIGLSAVDGNMLSIKDDGLYVSETKVPEYSIERQPVAEDGFAVTYKLKRVLDGEISYVGDVINLPRDLVLQSATLETVTEDGIPYADAKVGDPYIKMVFNNAEASNLYIPVKGLVDTYTAGSGIEIINNKISVKLADTTHGLVAVDGALTINLATRKSDGAMSKEDKKIVDSIPYAYVARKYDISGTPVGTLVDYRDHEIRVMCPVDAEFKKQSVGTGGDANAYYMTFKTYAPNDSAVGYIEHIGDQVDPEILTKFSVDEYGRKYQTSWLGIAKYDEVTGTWSYYGSKSTASKFIGWDYQIDWYDSNNKMIASDCVRINLSNESCHNITRPYYGPENDIITEVESVKETVAALEESYTWLDM